MKFINCVEFHKDNRKYLMMAYTTTRKYWFKTIQFFMEKMTNIEDILHSHTMQDETAIQHWMTWVHNREDTFQTRQAAVPATGAISITLVWRPQRQPVNQSYGINDSVGIRKINWVSRSTHCVWVYIGTCMLYRRICYSRYACITYRYRYMHDVSYDIDNHETEEVFLQHVKM